MPREELQPTHALRNAYRDWLTDLRLDPGADAATADGSQVLQADGLLALGAGALVVALLGQYRRDARLRGKR